MDRNELEVIIAQSIQGELSPREEALLKQVLDHSEEARRTYDSMRKVWDMMDVWQAPEPPASLQSSFATRLAAESKSSKSASKLIQKLERPHRKWFQWRMAWNLAGLGLAAALVFGVFQIFSTGVPMPGSSLSPNQPGTIMAVATPITTKVEPNTVAAVEQTATPRNIHALPTKGDAIVASFNRVPRGSVGVFVDRIPDSPRENTQADFAVHNYATNIPEMNTQHSSTILASYENPL